MAVVSAQGALRDPGTQPHVVRLLDHGYSRGTFFLVLEYCDGGSVDQLMSQRGGKLPVDEAVEILLQALAGLEYAHQADIPFVKKKGGGYVPGKGLIHFRIWRGGCQPLGSPRCKYKTSEATGFPLASQQCGLLKYLIYQENCFMPFNNQFPPHGA